MERLQAYRYELMPTGPQERQMRQFAGACRFVYNRALALQLEQRQTKTKRTSFGPLCRLLTAWRRDTETAWLADSPVHATQQALKNLETAWSRHFESIKKLRRAEIKPDQIVEPPVFKKKHKCSDSFRFPDFNQIKLEQHNSRIFLPKLGWIRYRNSRDVLGEIRNATIKREGDKWFVSIQTLREVEEPVHPSTSTVGVDMGVVRFATLSDGTVVEPINSFQKHQRRLAKYQRRLARKEKFSSNWKKAKAKVSQCYRDIANARKDLLHKTSAAISKKHALVILEDLQIGNMSRSAAGTVENPGTNVRQKSGLNRSILNQAWGEFRRQISYKELWTGGLVYVVPPQNTSRTCPKCGHCSADNRTTQALFLCVRCSFRENADLVSSWNVKAVGLGRVCLWRCGAVRPPTNEEPAEARLCVA